jgi:hypothetical protein
LKEEWKDIKGYENKYQISNTGKVKSLNFNNTKKEKILTPKINKQGYLEIKLSKDNKTKDFMVNRLVIEHFTNFKLNKNIIVLYKDNNPINCSLNNLYYTTRGEYQEFTYDKGKRKRIIVEYRGIKMPIKNLPFENGVDVDITRNRLSEGWSVEEAIAVPKGVIKC